MSTRLRTLAVGAMAAGAVAVLPAGAALAESSSPGIPPVPPISALSGSAGSAGDDANGDVQTLPVPGGSIVQGPAGQTFVPDGFVLVPSPDGEGQQVVPG